MSKKTELDKALRNSKVKGFGIYDAEKQLSINPENLSFMWAGKEKETKPLEELILLRALMTLKKIYKDKFGDDSPYDLKLFNKDPAEFMERMIRAVEICTLNHVLQTGEGALNMSPRMSMVKGKRSFIWEP